MKPRKKQRTDVEAQPEKASTKKHKPKAAVQEDPEESLGDEGLEEVIEDVDDEDDLDGKISYPQTITRADEMAIEDAPDSEEDEQDDFQDVKSKSILLSYPHSSQNAKSNPRIQRLLQTQCPQSSPPQ